MAPVDISLIAEAIHHRDVVRHAHHRPFGPHFLNSRQEELSEASRLFDLPEYRFDDRLLCRLDGSTSISLNLSPHPVSSGRSLRQWPTATGFLAAVFLFLRRYVRVDPLLFQMRQILFGTISAVGQQLIRLLCGSLFNGLHHRRHLLLVIGLLRDRLRHNQLRRAFHDCLHAVGLHKAIRPFHDARFRVAEIVLGFVLGCGFPGFLLALAFFFGLFPGSLLQSTHGLANLFQPCFPPAEFFGQFVAAVVFPISSVFFIIRRPGLREQYPDYFPQTMFILLHGTVAHGKARAWALREFAMTLFERADEDAARQHFRWLYNWATHKRLKAIIEVARILKIRLSNILTYLKHRITNATSEFINSKTQWVKYTARGFRNKKNVQAAIYCHSGALDLAFTHLKAGRAN